MDDLDGEIYVLVEDGDKEGDLGGEGTEGGEVGRRVAMEVVAEEEAVTLRAGAVGFAGGGGAVAREVHVVVGGVRVCEGEALGVVFEGVELGCQGLTQGG